jgi:hypothetical protein
MRFIYSNREFEDPLFGFAVKSFIVANDDSVTHMSLQFYRWCRFCIYCWGNLMVSNRIFQLRNLSEESLYDLIQEMGELERWMNEDYRVMNHML